MASFGSSVSAQPRHLGRYGIRELDVGGTFDHGLWLLRDNFRQIAMICLFVFIPLDVLHSTASEILLPDDSIGAVPFEAPGQLAILAGLTLLHAVVIYPLALGPLTVIYLRSYLGHTPTVREALKTGIRILPRLALANFLMMIIFATGFVMCIIPGLAAYIALSFVTEAIIVENAGVIAALERSFRLVTRSLGSVIAVSAAMTFAEMAVNSLVMQLPTPWLYIPIGSVTTAGLLSFSVAVYLTLYFSARCRNEAHDLELLAGAVDAASLARGNAL